MIGVVVPVHNEQAMLDACLESLIEAAAHPGLAAEEVRLCVVLDACTDASIRIVKRHAVTPLSINRRNVGAARAAGAGGLLAAKARWLAFTDADSAVASDWLVMQLRQGADAVCGTVTVGNWSMLPPYVQARYQRAYVNADGHRHIHGANFGVSADAYQRAGGFPPLRAHEDVHLIQTLEATGARIAWSAAPRVTTSARTRCRAPEGFGAYIASLCTARHPDEDLRPPPAASALKRRRT